MLMEKVAFRRGSSQHGKARRAAVGWKSVSTPFAYNPWKLQITYLKLSESIILRLAFVLPRRLIVTHHVSSNFCFETDLEFGL